MFGTRLNLSASGVICNNFRMTSGHGSMITVVIHEKCLHVTFTVISSVNKSMLMYDANGVFEVYEECNLCIVHNVWENTHTFN